MATWALLVTAIREFDELVDHAAARLNRMTASQRERSVCRRQADSIASSTHSSAQAAERRASHANFRRQPRQFIRYTLDLKPLQGSTIRLQKVTVT
jgi:hypothetical protein